MCVLAFSWRSHPGWPLILIGNRDESHARPADALAPWTDDRDILGGRDRVSLGGWLAVSPRRRRLSVITNLTGQGPADPTAPSRGDLVRDALTGEQPAHALARYNPFSLISVADDQAQFTTNRPTSETRLLAPGVHALSNGPFGAPWDKTQRLKAALSHWLDRGSTDPRALFASLDDRSSSMDRASGRPEDAPIFVSGPLYGTRCSTVVAVDARGNGLIAERRFDANGDTTGENEITFCWSTAPSASAE